MMQKRLRQYLAWLLGTLVLIMMMIIAAAAENMQEIMNDLSEGSFNRLFSLSHFEFLRCSAWRKAYNSNPVKYEFFINNNKMNWISLEMKTFLSAFDGAPAIIDVKRAWCEWVSERETGLNVLTSFHFHFSISFLFCNSHGNNIWHSRVSRVCGTEIFKYSETF